MNYNRDRYSDEWFAYHVNTGHVRDRETTLSRLGVRRSRVPSFFRYQSCQRHVSRHGRQKRQSASKGVLRNPIGRRGRKPGWCSPGSQLTRVGSSPLGPVHRRLQNASLPLAIQSVFRTNLVSSSEKPVRSREIMDSQSRHWLISINWKQVMRSSAGVTSQEQ